MSKNMRQRVPNELMLPVIIAIIAILGHNNVTADEVPAFFLKIAKSLPRFGRSYDVNDYLTKHTIPQDDNDWHGAQEVHQISKRKIGFSPETETWNWKHFPLTIEGPTELWKTLAGYSNDPLYNPSVHEFNNELWTHDKRANE